MEELQESELGTQDYWERRYKEEIDNFENHGDPGEIWFGEDIVQRIIKWIKKRTSIQSGSKFLDLGCGNGMFLIELAVNGYTNLYGVDYSEGAVTLALSIAKERQLNINFSTCNVLEGLNGCFDVIHDKGTYDAISLSKNSKEHRSQYLESVYKSLLENGLFIITSCNWTRSELEEHFQNHFVCVDVIPTPQFKFGGKTGNVVTSLIFEKKLK